MYIGDFVSFTDRIIAAKTLEDVLSIRVILVIVKYVPAGLTISGSTPIHTGINGARTSAIISRTVPEIKAKSTDCPASFFKFFPRLLHHSPLKQVPEVQLPSPPELNE